MLSQSLKIKKQDSLLTKQVPIYLRRICQFSNQPYLRGAVALEEKKKV